MNRCGLVVATAFLSFFFRSSYSMAFLTDSGQDACFDADGMVIACPEAGQNLAGQDGAYHLLPPAFADNGDGTVQDQRHQLIWMKEDDGILRTWQEASDYCDALATGSRVNWRLPTFPELLSLVDYGTTSPAIHSPFQCQDTGGYWTATVKSGDTAKAGAVDCDSGADYWLNRDARLYVRCVHDGEI